MLYRLNQEMLSRTIMPLVRAASPGQSAVFYNEENCLIGGGIITKAEN